MSARWNTQLGIAAAVFMAYRKGWFSPAHKTMTTPAEPSIVISIPQKTYPPEAYLPEKLPTKLQRFRHPGHQHKMFLSMVRFPQSVVCDNQKCQRAIQFCETVLTCPRCDIDICAHCFSQPLDAKSEPVELAANDAKINEDLLFSPYRFESEVSSVTFRTQPQKEKRQNRGTPCIHATVPNQPLDAAQHETFSGVVPVPHSHDADDEEDEEYDEDEDDEDEEDEDFIVGQQIGGGAAP